MATVVWSLLLLLFHQHYVGAAPCPTGDVTTYTGVVLDECFSNPLVVNSENKDLTVHYTRTNGDSDDRLQDVVVSASGDDSITAEEIVERVWEWTAMAWQVYSANSFPDPANRTDFHVHVFDLPGAAGSCCRPDATFHLKSFTLNTFILDSPNLVPGLCFHELFHAVSSAVSPSGLPQWLTEGTAVWATDKVDLALDIESDWFQYNGNVENFFYFGKHTTNLLDLRGEAALFWTYVTEQAGSTLGEPQNGLDVMFNYWWDDTTMAAVASLGDINRVEEFLTDDERSIETFFADWGTANYAHPLRSIPPQFRYADSEQLLAATLSGYGQVSTSTLLDPLSATMPPWSNQYLKLNPVDSRVRFVNFRVVQDTSHSVAYTLLLIRDDELVEYVREDTGIHFVQTLVNMEYDEIVLVISTFQDAISWRSETTASNDGVLTVNIVRPVTLTNVGHPLSPSTFVLLVEIEDTLGSRAQIIGLDEMSLSIMVGTEDVTEISSFVYIGDLYRMLIQAPGQSMSVLDDPLSITVSYDTFSDTNEGVIVYTDAPRPVASVLTIDRSGSMSINGKMDAAIDAGRLYVDSFEAMDQLAVVSYAAFPVSDVPLGTYESVRGTAMTEIGDLMPSGLTSLGRALNSSLAELVSSENWGDWSIVFLTDGINTVGPDIDAFEATWTSRATSGMPCDTISTAGCVPKVHTIAIGPDANRAALRSLSLLTLGTHQYATEPGTRRRLHHGTSRDLLVTEEDLAVDLAAIYRVISEIERGTHQVNATRGDLSTTETMVFEFTVDVFAEELTVVFFWVDQDNGSYENSYCSSLHFPNGTFAGEKSLEGQNYHIWKIPNPISGLWTLALSYCVGKFLAEASVSSPLSMTTLLMEEDPTLPGKPVMLRVVLTAASSPIGNVIVSAAVYGPTGESWTIVLYDDGLHNDEDSNDGVYSGIFPFTFAAGSYQVFWNATGSDFSRTGRTAFAVTDAVDSDGDGLPDRYEDEKFQCLDLARNDANEDADFDGLNNFEEYKRGTDPCNADTDGGGESDGSEVNSGRDPLDRQDDDAVATFRSLTSTNRLTEFTDECISANAAVLFYGALPSFVSMTVWRALSETGARTELTADLTPTGMFKDTSVTLGQKYCYWMAGRDISGVVSNTLGPSCTVPLENPLCLESVFINNGSATTDSSTVRVTIVAWGGVDMRLSNSFPFDTSSPWQPFTETITNWELDPVDGVAAVFVEVRDAGGSTDVETDTIRTPPTLEEPNPPGSCANRYDCTGFFSNGVLMNLDILNIFCVDLCIAVVPAIFLGVGFRCGKCE